MTERDRSAITRGASRIARRLWMGPRPPTGHALQMAGFKVLALCAEEYQPPRTLFPGISVIYCPLDDSGRPMTRAEKARALGASATVAESHRDGRRVLVTCNQGRNRSGLVVALALHNLYGHDGWACIDWVRKQRNPGLPASTPGHGQRPVQRLRRRGEPEPPPSRRWRVKMDLGRLLTANGSQIPTSASYLRSPLKRIPEAGGKLSLYVKVTMAAASVIGGVEVSVRVRYGDTDDDFALIQLVNEETGDVDDALTLNPGVNTTRTYLLQSSSAIGAKGGLEVRIRSGNTSAGIAGDIVTIDGELI